METSSKLVRELAAKLDLSQYGINNVQEIYYNLTYDELYEHETNPALEGFDKGFVTNTGAVNVRALA